MSIGTPHYLIDCRDQVFRFLLLKEKRLKNLKLSFIVTLCFFSLAANALKLPVKPTVIYDEDDRKDYNEISQTSSFDGKRSVLAIIYNENINTLKNGEVHIDGKSIGEERQLCASETFRDQLAVADCTAFLIAPNIAVTAGHCMNTVQDCKKKKFVQNYAVTASNDMKDAFFVYNENVATCTEIIAREKNQATGLDYAILKLDRDLESNHYFKMRTEGSVELGAKLTVMGYPSGLPLKYTQNSVVRENTNPIFFQMNADTFGGNSGSPVIDEVTGLVEGILVRGERDYELDRAQNCYRAKKCQSGFCRGEDAVRTTQLPVSTITEKASGPLHNDYTLPRTE